MPSKNQTRPVNDKIIASDEHVLSALAQIANYNPLKPECAVNKIAELHAEYEKCHEAHTAAESALMTATDHLAVAGWNFHNVVLQAKEQIRAQFGSDSVEIQSLGLKRASERKRPVRKNSKGPSNEKT